MTAWRSSPIRPNRVDGTGAAPGGAVKLSTATSVPGSDQASSAAAAHWPGRSASKRTSTSAAPATTWNAVRTAEPPTWYPEPRRPPPAAVVTMTSAMRCGSSPPRPAAASALTEQLVPGDQGHLLGSVRPYGLECEGQLLGDGG